MLGGDVDGNEDPVVTDERRLSTVLMIVGSMSLRSLFGGMFVRFITWGEIHDITAITLQE